MNIDDLICVGATDNILLSSTIGRNKRLIPGEVISAIIGATEELVEELRSMGVSIHPTGGETADVGDLVRTIIVDSTVACRMRRADVIDNARISAYDLIVGMASYGKAAYEKEYNGGMGSNGLHIGTPRRVRPGCSRQIPRNIRPRTAPRAGILRHQGTYRPRGRRSPRCRTPRPLAHAHICPGGESSPFRTTPVDTRHGALLGRRADKDSELCGRQTRY